MATLKQSLTHRLVVMHHRSPVEQVPLRHRDPPPPPLRPIRQQRHPGPAYPPRRHLNSCASTRSSSNTRMKMPAGLLMSIPDFLGALRAITTSSGRRVVTRYGSWGAKGRRSTGSATEQALKGGAAKMAEHEGRRDGRTGKESLHTGQAWRRSTKGEGREEQKRSIG